MNDISISQSLWAGFRLVGRQPVAFALWVLLYLVVVMGPVMAIFSMMTPFFSEVMSAANSGATPDPTKFFQSMMQMQILQLVATLGQLVVFSVLYAAIYRAVMYPDQGRFGFLRIGLQEVLIGLVIIAAYFALVFGIFAVILLAAGLVFAAAQASVAVAVIVGILFGLGLLVGLFLLVIRMSLLLPMTFAERKIDFGKAWAMTRGRMGWLSLLGLLQIAVGLGMSMVLGVVYGAVILVALGANSTALEHFMSQPTPDLFKALTPWAIVFAVVGGAVNTFNLVVWSAPWASVYRQIIGQTRDAEAVFA